MKDKPITLADGSVIRPDDELYPLAKMTPKQLERLVDNIHSAVLALAKTELQKALIRKLDRQLTDVERKLKVGQYKVDAIRKSIRGQDSDGDTENKWPSLSKIL